MFYLPYFMSQTNSQLNSASIWSLLDELSISQYRNKINCSEHFPYNLYIYKMYHISSSGSTINYKEDMFSIKFKSHLKKDDDKIKCFTIDILTTIPKVYIAIIENSNIYHKESRIFIVC